MADRPYPQVKQRTFTLEELSRRADPEWVRDRNYITAYKFTGRSFTDHRDHAYQYEPSPEHDLTAGGATFTLTGRSASFVAGRGIALDQGSFALTGQTVGFGAFSRLVSVDAGMFALTGNDVALRSSRMTAAVGTFVLTGMDADLGNYDLRTLAGDEAGNRRVLAGDQAGNARRTV